MSDKVKIQFPYGAVYFRKSNPPRQDWERDYRVAQEDGMNIFRHWFMWGAIEVSPGVYDWSDYDRHMDLAAEHGMKVIIAEFMDAIPEWLYYEHKDILFRHADGSVAENHLGVSCPAGGFGAGPCLDNPKAREMGGAFLRALAAHYKGHPALLGYDIWNETNYPGDVCYCDATKQAFREWLKRKYGTLKALGEAWMRYSFTDWAQVMPPKTLDFYAEAMDWLMFRKQNVYEQMKWRVEQIRSVDTDCLIAAHGTAASIDRQALCCYDEWAAAENVELYGLTYVPCRHTGAPWKFWGAVDLTRAGARGKTIWHAEMQGGPLWLQPQVLNRPLNDGRVPTAEDVRLYNLTSMACGTRGILYPRWRPILNGPLFGAFGPYGMDGSRTPRSQMASRIAKWCNDPEQRPLMAAVPTRGQAGILMLPEAQMGSYLLSLHGGRHAYPASVWGAYRAFFDNNIQADFVHLDDIDRYRLIYLPYAVAMNGAQAERLKQWVEKGGALISEACPGYFNSLGAAGATQPNFGMDALFGAREQDVQFTPDILDEARLSVLGMPVWGGVTLQTYTPTTGQACGYLAGGRIAAVKNRYGKGQTLLIGTHPAEAYSRTGCAQNSALFKAFLDFAGLKIQLECDNPSIKARIHADGEKRYVWAVNTGANTAQAKLSFDWGAVCAGKVFWGENAPQSRPDGGLQITVGPKDALIFEVAAR